MDNKVTIMIIDNKSMEIILILHILMYIKEDSLEVLIDQNKVVINKVQIMFQIIRHIAIFNNLMIQITFKEILKIKIVYKS